MRPIANNNFCNRSVDPHGLNRGRKLSVGHRGSTNGDHGLDALAEGPEDDDDANSDTDTMSTSPRVRILTVTESVQYSLQFL